MAKGKMKAWYDDIDAATLQRIKTYSAFNDATSKNLMVQTMYEYREKEIQDFKKTNHELAETCIERKKRIAVLEERTHTLEVYLEGAINFLILSGDIDNPIIDYAENILHITFYRDAKFSTNKLTKAKEIIERLVEGIRIISDPKIYMTDVDTFVSEAEQFLEEN